MVVLDVEMAVKGLCQRYFREPLLELFALVPQFMRRVDPHTGNHAGSHRERELLPRRHRRVHPAPGDEYETDVLEGQEQIRAPAVETILLQFRDRFVRWAVPVLARQ